MTSPTAEFDADAARRTWSVGDYPRVGDLWASVGQRLVEDLDDLVGLCDRDLTDVACGHGTTAIAAARHGAVVTAVDLTPQLLDETRRRADQAGVHVEVREGDFHDLPLDQDTADIVTSTFGVFLSARPHVVARELARIVRRGGHVAVTAWTRGMALEDIRASVVDVFPAYADHLAGLPDLRAWSEVDGLTRFFTGTRVVIEDHRVDEVVLPVASAEELVTVFGTSSGPFIETRQQVAADDPDGWARVERRLTARWAERLTDDGIAFAYGRALLRAA